MLFKALPTILIQKFGNVSFIPKLFAKVIGPDEICKWEVQAWMG